MLDIKGFGAFILLPLKAVGGDRKSRRYGGRRIKSRVIISLGRRPLPLKNILMEDPK
jgi:hypothetical protein